MKLKLSDAPFNDKNGDDVITIEIYLKSGQTIVCDVVDWNYEVTQYNSTFNWKRPIGGNFRRLATIDVDQIVAIVQYIDEREE